MQGADEQTKIQFARDTDAEGSAARELTIHTSDKADDREVGRRSYGYNAAKSIRMHILPDWQRTGGYRAHTVMLPGYVFFEAPDDVNIILRFPRSEILRILVGNDQDWRLIGSDYEFAKWLFDYDGCIGFSTAYQEGDRIRIASVR